MAAFCASAALSYALVFAPDVARRDNPWLLSCYERQADCYRSAIDVVTALTQFEQLHTRGGIGAWAWCVPQPPADRPK